MILGVAAKVGLVAVPEVAGDDEVERLEGAVMVEDGADALLGHSVEVVLLWDLGHVHLWQIFGAAVKVFTIFVLDRPAHIDGGVDVQAADPRTSRGAYGEQEPQEALPSAAAGEFKQIFTPEIHGRFVVNLTARPQEPCRHFFADVRQTLLVADFELILQQLFG